MPHKDIELMVENEVLRLEDKLIDRMRCELDRYYISKTEFELCKSKMFKNIGRLKEKYIIPTTIKVTIIFTLFFTVCSSLAIFFVRGLFTNG